MRTKSFLNLSSLSFLTFSLMISSSAMAMNCSMIHWDQSAKVQALVEYDAYKQWLSWEQTANFALFRQSSQVVELPVAEISMKAVEIQKDSALPQEIYNVFVHGKSVRWVKHPGNETLSTPFRDEANVGVLKSHYTASRSMGMIGELRGYSLKLPTNRPHPNAPPQNAKANTSDDVKSALLHSAHINARDKILGEDPVLMILPEVLTIAEKGSKIGLVLRDLRKTDDGHYYLPALSIPYIGREIAKINKKPFESFWEKNYAQVLGEAKARMLLRYGLQMETPNSQNMLIQLDRDLKPTGRIAFRDVSDAFFVGVVAKELGFEESIKADRKVGYKPVTELNPFISNSIWRFDEAREYSVNDKALQSWKETHNLAYTKYILKELKIKNENLLKPNDNDVLTDLQAFLFSPQGRKALAEYKAQSHD